ncbi:hypothetical protein [Achromobacter sp.]|uniref:hypothetical protein n=1 Tax=Achromobacter sp. TaxID=134375 RepID=UPI0028A63631|nr:hypothetical protein [Achromobacter sp.]
MLNVVGSNDIACQGNITLIGQAKRTASERRRIRRRNVSEQRTTSKSSSASICIGYSTSGQDESWTNSSGTAGNVLAIQSSGDTTLEGASGKADECCRGFGGNRSQPADGSGLWKAGGKIGSS